MNFDNVNECFNIGTNSITNMSPNSDNIKNNSLRNDTISASFDVSNDDSGTSFSKCDRSENSFLFNNSKTESFPGRKFSLEDSFDKGINKLQEIKVRNVNRISIEQININSLRNKFEFLNEFVKGYIDILLQGFPIANFSGGGIVSPQWGGHHFFSRWGQMGGGQTFDGGGDVLLPQICLNLLTLEQNAARGT